MDLALAYVALISHAPEVAGTLLSAVLGLPAIGVACGGGMVPAFPVGQAALVVVPPGHALVDGAEQPGVHHIALAADDPAGVAARAGLAVRAGREGGAGEGLGGAPSLALDPAATAGVRTRLTTPPGLAPGASPLVERIDHIGIASADNAAGLAVFCDRLGLPLESRQTDMEVALAVESFTSDKYGVVYHTRPPVPVGGLRVAFVTAGDCELEFLQNFDPSQGAEIRHDAAGTTRQDQGAIARFVAARGAGLHHVALKTPDIEAALAALDRAGARLVDRVGRPGSRRARIGFVHPAALGGVLLHFVERTPL